MFNFILVLIFSLNFAFASEVAINYNYKLESNASLSSIQFEFKNIASDVFYVGNFVDLLNIKYDFVLDTLRKLEFKCASDLEVDNEKKDAINFPHRVPQLLLLNCLKWRNSLTNNQKKILVTHELLPLLGIEDLDYSNSSYVMKIHGFYKTSRLKFLQAPIEELNHKLIMSIFNCDVEEFFSSVKLGADIFSEKSRDRESYLVHAIEKGCKDIAFYLIKFNLSLEREKEFLPMFLALSLDFNNKLFKFEDRKAMLKELVKFYPDVKDDVILTRKQVFFTSELDNFGLNDSCYYKSNALHFWYSGLRSNSKYTQYIKDNIDFLKGLGVSTSDRNICGDRPFYKL